MVWFVSAAAIIFIVVIAASIGSRTKSSAEKGSCVPVATRKPDRGVNSQSDDDDVYCADGHNSFNGKFRVEAMTGEIDTAGRQRKGFVRLVDAHSKRVLWINKVTNPNHPRVSDIGISIVEDWKNKPGTAALIAFSADGSQLWIKHFRCNLLGWSDISADATRVVVSTPSSYYESSDNKTYLIDGHTGETIWKMAEMNTLCFVGNSFALAKENEDGTTRLEIVSDEKVESWGVRYMKKTSKKQNEGQE